MQLTGETDVIGREKRITTLWGVRHSPPVAPGQSPPPHAPDPRPPTPERYAAPATPEPSTAPTAVAILGSCARVDKVGTDAPCLGRGPASAYVPGTLGTESLRGRRSRRCGCATGEQRQQIVTLLEEPTARPLHALDQVPDLVLRWAGPDAVRRGTDTYDHGYDTP